MADGPGGRRTAKSLHARRIKTEPDGGRNRPEQYGWVWVDDGDGREPTVPVGTQDV
jgi:hypothetical protein